MSNQTSLLHLTEIRHPGYYWQDWQEWRDTFEGGRNYLVRYLKKFSEKESDEEYQLRLATTPIPTFAKAAILDIRNSIFQRLEEISRIGGSKKYSGACAGEGAGVDRDGSSMNSFIGIDVLTELLIMGRCGIYVDAPNIVPTTMAEEVQSPYLYYYCVEDILSWALDDQAEDGTFKAVLLRDYNIKYNTDYHGISLPEGRETRYRLVWKDDFGKVWCRFYNIDKEIIYEQDSDPVTGDIELGISVVPFVMPNIGDSLLKDVSSYQVALLNLVSGDVNWSLKSNVPFLTIQEEMRTAGAHLKKTADSATPGSQHAQDSEVQIGNVGRRYDVGMDRPGYIAPPTAPLEASMKLQEKLEDDIRRLVNLAVINKVGSRTESAEAKKLSSQGLEAGLSYIGMVLQQAEQAVARYWAMYEDHKNPKVATIGYPKRYILKEDGERLEEAKQLLDLIDRVPGKKVKKVILKQVVMLLLSGKQNVATIEAIMSEINAAGYTSSDVEAVLRDHKAGLVGDELASEARGYPKGEVKKAADDRAKRAAATLLAQTNPNDPGGAKNPASRGVPELDKNKDSGATEKEKE